MMKKIAVIGHFGFGRNDLDGQTIKTKIVTDFLCQKVGEQEVVKIDTHGGWKTLLKAPFFAIFALKKAKNVVMFPAHNGVRVFGRLLPCLKRIFKDRKIHYVVIGGWLPKMLERKKGLAKKLKKFDGIYVETNMMKETLEKQGFSNIYVMPNCKELKILREEELIYSVGEPYKLCTLSRVCKEKGIGDAVDAVMTVNEKLGKIVYTLDIYGAIDEHQKDWFAELQKEFPEYIQYRGIIPFEKSVEILSNYFALLFPTHFYTEGIPGTIIDAYSAGIPVVSAKWESFSDIIENFKTGIGYNFDEPKALESVLVDIADNPNLIYSSKKNCLNKANNYMPNIVIEILTKNLAN